MIFSKADFRTELELLPVIDSNLPREILDSRYDLLFSLNELTHYKLSIQDLNEAFILLADMLIKNLTIPESDKIKLPFSALGTIEATRGKLTQQEKIIFAFCVYYAVCVELYDKKSGKMFSAVKELNSQESIIARLQNEITTHPEKFAFLNEKKSPFGSKDNPAQATSQTNARIYLTKLYTSQGKHVKFSKVTSLPGANKIMLDLYDIKYDLSGETKEMQLYINPSSQINSTEAPEGLEYHDDDPDSLFTLGMKFFNGEGVKPDSDRAIQMLKKSAGRGHAESQYNLGLIYEGMHNFNESIKYFSQAAEQNHLRALVKLGNIYYRGEGVPQDYSKAAEYYSRAALKGDADSQYYLGFLYYSGDGVNQDKRRAVELWSKAALQGHAESQYIMGQLYRTGKDLRQNYNEAIKYFSQAAGKNHPESLFALGQMYENGEGVRRDINQVVKFYKLAAEQNNEDALKSLRRLGKI